MDEETVSCEELDRRCLETIRELQDRMDAYDERVSFQVEQWDDGKTTDQRAVEALRRPERFHGEHDIARAWLKQSETARLWTRGT